MKKKILKMLIVCALMATGGPAIAQLQSKIDFTAKQQKQIELLTKEYEKQGMDIKRARMKAQEDIAPDAVRLRVGTGAWVPGPSVLRPSLNPWPLTHADWLAAGPHPGSIEVDRDSFIHTYKPSELIKKVLLKAYTPEDEARIQNVRFLGFNGLPGGGDGWANNPVLAPFGVGNRGLAYFTKGTSSFDLEKGLLLSTGETWGHEGPNELDNAISDGVIEDGVSRGNLVMTTTYDADLANIAQQPVSLGGILEFDFSPAIDKASFDYVFGSEEYPEYVHSFFNDVFGFFISGPYDSPGASPTVALPATTWEKGRAVYNGDSINTYNRFNIAQLPNGMPVGVDWTNWGWRPWNNNDAVWDTPYAPNITAPWDTIGTAAAVAANGTWGNLHSTNSTLAFNPEYHRINKAGNSMMEMDGLTIKLTAVMDSLIPGKWYRLKIGIAQVDWQHGDGVFIGNLDLGQGTAGIGNGHGWAGWPAAYDSLGLFNFYTGCEQLLTIDFDPMGVTQAVKIVPMGAAANGNVVAPDGEELQLLDTLRSGETTVVRPFIVADDADFENGAEGWFITISYDPGNPATEYARDTTDTYKFYKRATTKMTYRQPTVGYAGILDLGIKDGSPDLFRSMNGGLTWERASQPLTKSQIANYTYGDVILLKEPNSCWMSEVTVDKNTGGQSILRPVFMPDVPGIVTSYVPGIHYINSGEDFIITVTLIGDQVGKVPVLITGRTSLPDSEGVRRINNGGGSYTFIIDDVREPINISFDFETGNASIENGNKAWSVDGQLYITSAEAGRVSVYDVTGAMVKVLAINAGETISTTLPTGIYVVTFAKGNPQKVTVK